MQVLGPDQAGGIQPAAKRPSADPFAGPTDAAGALVDPFTVTRGKKAGIEAAEFLDRNDAYHFFEKTNDLLVTGPTNTNVMDVRLVLAC